VTLLGRQHVSNVAETRDIAVQRETPYHLSATGKTPHMSDTQTRLPDGAEDISSGGFNLFAGPFYRLADEGETRRFAFIALPKHMNGSGTVHGGLLMTFADIAMSRTSRLATGARSCSTVALNCDFAGPGRLGDLIDISVRVSKKTRTLVFLSGDVATEGRPLMTATGLWKIIP
jgi:acyl-coenzyme A thioesterase PaaI-like protein